MLQHTQIRARTRFMHQVAVSGQNNPSPFGSVSFASQSSRWTHKLKRAVSHWRLTQSAKLNASVSRRKTPTQQHILLSSLRRKKTKKIQHFVHLGNKLTIQREAKRKRKKQRKSLNKVFCPAVQITSAGQKTSAFLKIQHLLGFGFRHDQSQHVRKAAIFKLQLTFPCDDTCRSHQTFVKSMFPN